SPDSSSSLPLLFSSLQPPTRAALFPYTTLFRSIMAELEALQADLGFGSYTAALTGTDQLNMFLLTASLMFGTAGLPHVIVRFYTDRKSTRLNSSHVSISYAVFCLNNNTRKSLEE